jgi:hypothetical protein
MDLNFYRFRSVWRVEATAGEAFTALSTVVDYPAWWPQVRAAGVVAPDACALTVRSLVPYDLSIVVRRARRDRAGGVLEATLSGDLDGFTRWTLYPGDTWTRLIFDQEVVVTNASLRRFSLVARPVYRADHAFMMRQGERGLRTYLAGGRAGRRPAQP